jgi:hypothetical protein
VFTQQFDFGDGSISSQGSGDIFITSRDTNNQLNWGQGLGGSGNDRALSCTEDTGMVYITGAHSSPDMDFGGGVRTWHGSEDLYVVALDDQGNYQWDYTTVTGNGKQRGYHVAVDRDSNVYVTGRFDGATDFGGGVRTPDGQDFFLVKLNPYGEYIWDYTAGGNHEDFAREVTATNDAVFVVGTFESDSVDFGGGDVINSGAPIQNPMHMVEGDYFILKLDTDGNYIEVRTALSGGSGTSQYGDDFARAITKSNNGNAIYVGGHYSDPIDFGGGIETSQGGRDIFVMKMIP